MQSTPYANRNARFMVLAERFQVVPVPIYGGALALLGLSLLLPIAWPSEPATLPWSEALMWAGIAALLGGLLTHAAKASIAPRAFMADLGNPATAPFLGQVGVAMALLCESWAPTQASSATWAFAISAVLAILALLHSAWLLVFKRPTWRDASPAWLLPPIQWVYLGTLASHEAPAWHVLLLAVGGLLALPVCACLLLRAWQGPAWPQPAKPALTIFLALPAMAVLATLQGSDPSVPWLMLMLSLTWVSSIVALAQLPRVVGHRFQVSWWAYGMPVSAAAIALNALSDHWHDPQVLALMAQILSVVATLMTLGLTVMGMRAVVRFFSVPSRKVEPSTL